MQTRVQRWGNSIALRIPEYLAEQAGLAENAAVELSLDNGRLVIEPVTESNLTLDELLADVTDENLHREAETGAPVGNEVW